MSTSDAADPAEAIASALARIRGRRGPHHGHGHGHGRTPSGHRPADPGDGGTSGPRFGGAAAMRMLEALVTAPTPLTVSELGDAIGVDQPRASRLVQQGVERGLVRREADPDDARRTRIALTDAGRELAHRTHSARRDALGRALADFSDAERRELARLLGKLADNWGSAEA